MGFATVRTAGGLALPPTAARGALRFAGGDPGTVNQNRVYVSRTAANAALNVGNADYFWRMIVRATAGNQTSAITPGADTNWTISNIILDGDTAFRAGGWGVGIAGGRYCYGLDTAAGGRTIGGGSGGTDWRGQGWVEIAGQRRRSDGDMRLWVNGALTGSGADPDGDQAYPGGTSATQCGPSGNLSCLYSDSGITWGVEKADLDHAQYPGFFGDICLVEIGTGLPFPTNGSGYTVLSATAPPSAGGNTLLLWLFGDQVGTQVTDSSANGFHGEIRAGQTGPTWLAESFFT